MAPARFLVLALLALSAASAVSAKVLVMGEENFEDSLADHKKVYFVKFFAPWCGHCKRLAPTWEDLSNLVKDNVVIGHVDCTEEKDFCGKQEIRGYPTLKVFVKGKEQQTYSGSRELDTLKHFIEDVADSLSDD